jgi:N-acetylmuramoyl-L-alanine amidase
MLVLVLGLALAGTEPLCAQTIGSANNFWFAGTRLAFEHPQLHAGQFAVATDDAALGAFLAKVGAVLSYQPGQNYVVFTSADRRVITFTLGDSRFNVAGVDQSAGFAPYVAGNVAFVPFLDLARALFVDPVQDGATTVMQPQIAALEVRPDERRTFVTLRGATPLQFKRTSGASEDTVSLLFTGIASTLEPQRPIDAAGLRAVTIAVGGTPRNPTTTITFETPPGSVRSLAPSESPNSLTLAFAPAGTQLGGTPIPATEHAAPATAELTPSDQAGAPAQPAPAPVASLPPSAADQTAISDTGVAAGPAMPSETATPTAYGLAPATITGLRTQSLDGAFNVSLAISGNVVYEFHRLSDNRWYVDFKPATLGVPNEDQSPNDPSVLSLRVKPFVGPVDRLATVRVALSLQGPRAVNLVPSSEGLTIEVSGQDDPAAQSYGTGELLPGRLYTGIVPLPPVSVAPGQLEAPDEPWKFGRGVQTNSRLIVIDPGHGGSDTGAMHNGLVEKELNLDISKRLRAILIARGWEVKMTRDSDVDVFGPNASARDELQARDDVANKAGARLFVSIHINSFTSGDLNGTTTYYYKATSYALADAVHARLAAALPSKDDGIRKDNFYVIHHATMPAILVETAFLSNSADAQLLKSSAFLQKVAGGIADGIADYASGSQPLSNEGGSSADGI